MPGVGYSGFVWSPDDGMNALAVLPGDNGADATSINNAGTIVGLSYRAGLYRAVKWEEGLVSQLPVPEGTSYSYANGVNNAGVVVGTILMPGVLRAALWEHGRLTLIETLPLAEQRGSNAKSINARGDVIGTANTAAGMRAFFKPKNGTAIDLGTLGGPFSEPHGVSENGHVVGLSGIITPSRYHAFVWSGKRGLVDLGTLPGGAVRLCVGRQQRGRDRWILAAGRRPPCRRDLEERVDPRSELPRALWFATHRGRAGHQQ